MAVITALVAYLSSGGTTAVFSTTCAILLLITAFAPAWLRVPFVLAMALTTPIGWIVSQVILAFIFFVLVTPLGLLLRLIGRSELDVDIDRAAQSYWRKREQPRDYDSYFRQS